MRIGLPAFAVHHPQFCEGGAAGVLYRINLTPSSLSATANDAATTFSAAGVDYFGSAVAVSGTWDVQSGVGMANSATGAYTPGTVAGPAVVRFTDTATGKTGTASVSVAAGAPATVTLSPSTVSVPESGTTNFSSTVVDAFGNVTSATATLSATNGTIDAAGHYTAPAAPGSDTVTAAYTGLTSATATVTVTAVIDRITVTAATDSPVVGTTDAFTATAYDASNNPLTGIVFTWTTTSGTITTGGVLTLPTATETITVTATSAGVSGTHSVTSVPDVVNSVTVSPSSATVAEGGTQAYTATVKDQYGNVRTGDTVTWSIAGQLVAYAVAVSPSSVSVALNGTQVFTATVTDKYGNTISSPTVTWSATHGSFVGSTYTAPASGTSDTVTATSGAASGTAAVTLTGGAATLTSPTGTTTGATTASGTVSTNTGSGTLYWVASTSAVAPSVAQIQLGHDQSGSAAPSSGNQAVSATGTQTLSPAATGLTAGTTYYLYYQQHTTGGDSTVVSSSSFTTVAIATLSSPTGTQTGSTTASGTVSTTQGTGTLYWVVSTSATPPSVAQIQLGHDSSGSTAAAHGSQSVSATGSQSISATGLTASTTYYAYYQQNDSAGNSTVVSSTSFTTASSHLYGSDSFTNATTELLSTYDSRWASWNSQGDTLNVVGGANYVADSTPTTGGHTIYALTLTGITANQQLTADVHVGSAGQGVYLALRLQGDGTSGYIFSIGNGTAITLQRVVSGSVVHTFTTAGTVTAGTTTTVVVKVTGTTISVQVAGGTVETFTDATYATGNPGAGTQLGSTPYTDARFTNVIVDNI